MGKFKNALGRLADNRYFCMAWLVACAAFVTWFGSLRVPLEDVQPLAYSKLFEKTVSVIAVTHPYLYYVWVILTMGAIYLNITYMYRRNNFKSKTGITIMYISFIFLVMTIIVPHHDEGSGKIVHWASALLFAFLSAGAILIYLFKMAKRSRRYLATLCVFIAVPVLMITLLIIFGENGAIELLPMWLACVTLFLVNFTVFYRLKTPIQQAAPTC